jgi:hypothetical protein
MYPRSRNPCTKALAEGTIGSGPIISEIGLVVNANPTRYTFDDWALPARDKVAANPLPRSTMNPAASFDHLVGTQKKRLHELPPSHPVGQDDSKSAFNAVLPGSGHRADPLGRYPTPGRCTPGCPFGVACADPSGREGGRRDLGQGFLRPSCPAREVRIWHRAACPRCPLSRCVLG